MNSEISLSLSLPGTDAGHFSPAGSTEQTKCSPGTVQPDAGKATCDKCAAGTYQPDEGEQACITCKPGSYCPEGASAPLPCEEGTYSNETDLGSAGDCMPTTPGFHAPTGSTHQTKCNPGTFQSVAGKAECD